MLLAGAIHFSGPEIAIILAFLVLVGLLLAAAAGVLLGVAFRRRFGGAGAFFGGFAIGVATAVATRWLLQGAGGALALAPSNALALWLLCQPARESSTPPAQEIGPRPRGYQPPRR